MTTINFVLTMIIDVGVLHDIVVLAQELLPTLPPRERLPTNALFSAYDDILPRIGIDTDHDSRYARVLFKVGGLRGPGTLFEKFEEVLSRMGIEIEFDSHNTSEENSQVENPPNNIEGSIRGEPSENYISRGHRRRNSESTVWDLRDEVTGPRARRNSHTTGDRPVPRFEHHTILPEALAHSIHPPRHSNGAEEKDTALPNIGTWLESRPEIGKTKSRGRSISVHGSMRIRRGSTSRGRPVSTVMPSVPTSDEHQERSQLTEDTSYFGDDNSVQRLGDDQSERQAIEAPESLMQIKASVILEDHLKFLAKRQLRSWRAQAIQLREDNIGLNQIAARFDKRTLIRAALGIWRDQAVARRRTRIAQSFFAHLEERATRSRDLYLMHIAFTHWASFANEQVQRTALARRHIVRTRIFNAWRDITAVNELKVRRQVLKKFFRIWKRQHAVAGYEQASALQSYESGLVEKIFRTWKQKLLERKAIAHWAEVVKRRTLFQWIVVSHEVWENHCTAEEARQTRLAWDVWSIWRTKTRIGIQQQVYADDHYRNSVCRNSLRKWRRETCVIPAKTTVQSDVAVRLLRETLGVWMYRTQQERKAALVDRIRILREALTRWRHQLRHREMTHIINARLKSKSMYTICLARSAAVTIHRLNHNRLRRSFETWLHQWQVTVGRRHEQESLAHSYAIQRSQNFALAQWYSRMGSRKGLEIAAQDVYEPRLLMGIVSNWLVKAQHQRQLQKWSRDAEFYFLATRILKLWRASTESVQREKRKNAYAQVRRMVKVNLVRGILHTWKDQAQHILNLDDQAVDVRENRNVIVGMEIFDRWRGRAEELAELNSLARENVLKKHINLWKAKSEDLVVLQTEASITYQERRQSRAVKKWSLATLQLRAQSNYASDVCEKNAKKMFRKMFKYWRQKALLRRPLPRTEASESDQLLGTTAQAETWSDFGVEGDIDEWAQGLDEVTTSTPVPGYLATPSRRAERVLAVAARFSTTPKAPLSTPFERQLRAQYSGGQLPSLRKGNGKSLLGLGGGFADIPEHSINHEKESRT
jgi:protein SFI1